MLCPSCRSLPPELRRHPRGPLGAAASVPALRPLVCERCGAAAGPEARPRSLRETVLRLESAGLDILHPLLCAHPPHAA